MSDDHRFNAWVALTAFSVFCLAANVNENEQERIFFQTSDPPKKPQWKFVTATTAISTAVSLFAVVSQLVYNKKFAGKRAEIGATLLLITLWLAGLPIIQNPNNEIAQAGLFIIDYNLYFLSWLAFGTVWHIYWSLTHVSHQVQLWSSLTLASIVVTSSSTRLFRESTCKGRRFEVDCTRIKWAIALGASCTAIGLVVTFLQSRKLIGLYLETGLAAVVMILYAFGVGYITYGNGAGATVLDNLYFFLWIGFLIALFLASDGFYESMQGSAEEESDQDSKSFNANEDSGREESARSEVQQDNSPDVESNVEITAAEHTVESALNS